MDNDLRFFKDLDNVQLGLLVDIFNKKGSLTELISVSDEYKKYGKDYKKYPERIVEELLSFGSNTFWKNKAYKEILCIVCEKIGVEYNGKFPVRQIEQKLLRTVFEKTWQEMPSEDKNIIIEKIKNEEYNTNNDFYAMELTVDNFIEQAFSCDRRECLLAIVQIIFTGILEKEASDDTKKIVAEVLTAVAVQYGKKNTMKYCTGYLAGRMIALGSIVGSLMAVWSVYELTGPAYRVVIPCTILIAAYRLEWELNGGKKMDWSAIPEDIEERNREAVIRDLGKEASKKAIFIKTLEAIDNELLEIFRKNIISAYENEYTEAEVEHRIEQELKKLHIFGEDRVCERRKEIIERLVKKLKKFN